MPRFSAHVGYLFPELPLLERFDAVAKAGFKAVDMPVCYEVPPTSLRDAVKRNGLTPLGINTPKVAGQRRPIVKDANTLKMQLRMREAAETRQRRLAQPWRRARTREGLGGVV